MHTPGEESRRERLTPMQAAEKIKHYCAYAERCHSEVMGRLYEYGLSIRDAEPIIAALIEENYLNEERNAIQYAGGHFRLKGWGRVKILHALRGKNISAYCIQKAMAQIDEDAYTALLHKLARQKWTSLRGTAPAARWAKTRMYLLQRGFESHLVLQALQQLRHK